MVLSEDFTSGLLTQPFSNTHSISGILHYLPRPQQRPAGCCPSNISGPPCALFHSSCILSASFRPLSPSPLRRLLLLALSGSWEIRGTSLILYLCIQNSHNAQKPFCTIPYLHVSILSTEIKKHNLLSNAYQWKNNLPPLKKHRFWLNLESNLSLHYILNFCITSFITSIITVFCSYFIFFSYFWFVFHLYFFPHCYECNYTDW